MHPVNVSLVLVSIYQVKTLFKVRRIQEIARAARVRHDFEPEFEIYILLSRVRVRLTTIKPRGGVFTLGLGLALGLGFGSLIKILPITTDQGHIPHIPVLKTAFLYYYRCSNVFCKPGSITVMMMMTMMMMMIILRRYESPGTIPFLEGRYFFPSF